MRHHDAQRGPDSIRPQCLFPEPDPVFTLGDHNLWERHDARAGMTDHAWQPEKLQEAGGLQQARLLPEPLEPGTRWLHVDLLRLRAALPSDTVADSRGADWAGNESRAELHRALDDG